MEKITEENRGSVDVSNQFSFNVWRVHIHSNTRDFKAKKQPKCRSVLHNEQNGGCRIEYILAQCTQTIHGYISTFYFLPTADQKYLLINYSKFLIPLFMDFLGLHFTMQRYCTVQFFHYRKYFVWIFLYTNQRPATCTKTSWTFPHHVTSHVTPYKTITL